MSKTYKIFGDKSSLYAIVSTVGATVGRFVYKGKDLIYPEQSVDHAQRKRGGIPICFPNFGKAVGRFSGLRQHGWLRDEKLKFSRESDNVGSFFGKNKPSSEYPWLLEYKVTISVEPEEKKLTLKLEVVRCCDEIESPAPINPGFHPYFLADPFNAFSQQNLAKISGEQITQFHDQAGIVANEGRVEIRSGDCSLEMKAPECHCLVLWSDSPRNEYFCVEPILMEPSAFGDPDEGGEFLLIGNSFEMTFSLKIVS